MRSRLPLELAVIELVDDFLCFGRARCRRFEQALLELGEGNVESCTGKPSDKDLWDEWLAADEVGVVVLCGTRKFDAYHAKGDYR